MDFSQRLMCSELMDDPECDEHQLYRTLDQFRIVNRLFSRYRTLLSHTVLRDMHPDREYHLMDIGAGGCDIPVWLLGKARSRGLSLRITALDSDPRITRFAQARHGAVQGLHIVNDTGENLAQYTPVDYVFANHVLHHLDTDTIKTFIETSTRLADRGVVFSDLKRSRWSYCVFSVAARVFRNSFTRTDGLLSIRRSFRPAELEALAKNTCTSVSTLSPGRINLISDRIADN